MSLNIFTYIGMLLEHSEFIGRLIFTGLIATNVVVFMFFVFKIKSYEWYKYFFALGILLMEISLFGTGFELISRNIFILTSILGIISFLIYFIKSKDWGWFPLLLVFISTVIEILLGHVNFP